MTKKIISMCVAAFVLQPYSYALPSTANEFNINEATIKTVQRAIKSHDITCQQLVGMYINRIKKYDMSLGKAPSLNAIVAINPYVMKEAKKLDLYYQTHKRFSGPLFCVPVVVKDNIDTTDMTTTAGSLSMLGSQPTKDAFIIKKLRQAGALIIADAAMDEFASGMSGISSRSGRVGNVYDTSQNSGGSSAGTAVAVSANFALVGIGSDNSGSVRIPAAFNGDIGLRPSMGLISQTGIFPRGNLDGTAGPITRDVVDLAKVMSVIAQYDHKDPNGAGLPRPKSYTAFLKPDSFKGKRIGIVTKVGKVDIYKDTPEAAKMHFRQVYNRLRILGATVVNNVELSKFDTDRQHNTAGEIDDINHYLQGFPSTRSSFLDICHSERTRTFGSARECIQYANTNPSKQSAAYHNVLARFSRNRAYVEGIMSKDNLDALILPLDSMGELTYNTSHVNTWRAAVSSNSGLPAITISAGYTKTIPRKPIAMELIARKYQDGTLISMAYAYDVHFKTRLVPHLHQFSDLRALSIRQFNRFITTVGWQGYRKVLKNALTKQQVFSAEKFQRIVSQVAGILNVK